MQPACPTLGADAERDSRRGKKRAAPNLGGRPANTKRKVEEQYLYEGCVAACAAKLELSAEQCQEYHLSCKKRGLHFPTEPTELAPGQGDTLAVQMAHNPDARAEGKAHRALIRWLQSRIAGQAKCKNPKGTLIAIGDRAGADSKNHCAAAASVPLMFARLWHSAAIEVAYSSERGMALQFSADLVNPGATPVVLCYGLMDSHVKKYQMCMTVRVAGYDRVAWGPFALANGACTKHANVEFDLIPIAKRPKWLKHHVEASVLGLFLPANARVKKGEEVLLPYLMHNDVCPISGCGKVGCANAK